MSATLLLRGAGVVRGKCLTLLANQASLCMVRNASINSGINRGLRKSKGVGFREKDKGFARSSNVGGFDRGDGGFQPRGKNFRHRTNDRRDKSFAKNPSNISAKYLNRSRTDSEVTSNVGTSYDSGARGRPSFEKKPYQSQDRERPHYDKKSYGAGDRPPFERKPYQSRESGSAPYDGKYRGGEANSFSNRKPYESRNRERPPFEREPYQSRESGSAPYDGKYRGGEANSFSNRTPYESRNRERPSFAKEGYESRGGAKAQYDRKSYSSGEGEERSADHKYPSLSSRSPRTFDSSSDSTTRPGSSFERRMPITIPYTTPASEFLYGTSVVEAALHARAWKSRKLYKLYIHKGEDREHAERDGHLAKIASKKGVEVKEVSGAEWLRTLDKMSKGRPHNGYILEASPLPKLPVTGLAEVEDQEEHFLMKVNLDHQSAEDAAINGTSNLIKVPKDAAGRNPLVLFLDSIQDPQNLGAIVRTASFMGATAIAISVRNSSTFTTTALKASAGASENIPILSVDKPGAFITESKAAGWKVYAAVAPGDNTVKDDAGAIKSLSKTIYTDDLGDPLSEGPCILMLGGEGEGLRWGLRSHANVELSIKQYGRDGKLDSLNVGVATGILCDAFMRQAAKKSVDEAVQAVEEETKNLPDNRLY